MQPAHSACPACGGILKPLGENVSEILEYVPASFKVIRQVRPKLAGGCCDRIVQAPAPARPIERGLAGPGLLAHVLVGKYADHLPLYRQSALYAREGVELSRSTLAARVGAANALVRPLLAALGKYVLDTEKLHGDDTPIPVLAPGTGKTATSLNLETGEFVKATSVEEGLKLAKEQPANRPTIDDYELNKFGDVMGLIPNREVFTVTRSRVEEVRP